MDHGSIAGNSHGPNGIAGNIGLISQIPCQFIYGSYNLLLKGGKTIFPGCIMDTGQDVCAKGDLPIFQITADKLPSGEQIYQLGFKMGGAQIKGHGRQNLGLCRHKINYFKDRAGIINQDPALECGLAEFCGN